MKKNINLLAIALIMLSFFAFSGLDCESTGTELRVIGTKGNFSGYYIINGGAENFFTSSLEGDFSRFSKDLGVFRFVEVSVNKYNVEAAMDIYLYDVNGNLLQKVNNSACKSNYTTCESSTTSTMSYTSRH
jgi:hypothetical protein